MRCGRPDAVARRRGMKKGDLSKFVEDAVRWRVFDRRVQGPRNSMRDVPATELQDAIDKAVRDVRRARAARGVGKSRRGLRLLAKARGR